MLIARWAAAACIGIAASVGSAQVTQKLTNPMPSCPQGQTEVTMTFSGVDLHVTGGGVTLRCNTTIIVTGGDIYIDAPIYGMTPNSDPRPQGQDGNSSYNLTLITRCGPRLAEPGPRNTVAPRGYCGSIYIVAPVDLHGESGVDGQAGESAGDGYAGGDGGSGGNFTAESIKDINAYAIINTSGGNGGNGGPAGTAAGCDASGNAFGGWGSGGGKAGSVTLRNATGAVNTSTIRIGSGQNVYISAIGGSSGSGGAGASGEQHGCGGTAGSGGSAADGGSGGTVSITGLRVESYASNEYRVVYTNGGAGGNAGPGGSGGSCAINFLGGECGPPVNGGPAGNAGAGGAGGPITVYAYGTPLNGSDPGTLYGSFSCDAGGGQGGGGASGGNGGVYGEDCEEQCCGSGGFSQAGDSGGNGGLVNLSGTRVNLSALVFSRGGNGGWGTHGSCGGCGPCDCEQGGLGGAGGAGGNLVTQGNNPFGSWVWYDLTGGCGGGGGAGGPGAPCAPGGGHGVSGTFSDGLNPVSTSTNIGTPCSGSHGPDGNGMTCEGEPIPCS